MIENHLIEGRRLGAAFPLPPDVPFTYATARGAGLTRTQLRRLVEIGVLRRPIKGVYVAAELPDSIELRAACLRLVVPEDCVVVDRHAGWLLGAEMVLAPGEHIDLRPVSMFRPSGNGRLRNDLADSGERNLLPRDISTIHGLRVTTPLRTAWDLGRVRWTDEAITGLDAMFGLKAFSRQEFLDGIERFRGMRWVTTLRAIGPLADGRAESPPESILRLRCIECGLRDVVPQLELWDEERLVARLDLGERRLAVGFEYDGEEWHSSPDQLAHDRARRADAERLGWIIGAFRKDNLFGRAADAELMIRLLVRRAERTQRL